MGFIQHDDSKRKFRFIVIGDSRDYYEGVNKEVFERILKNVKGLEDQPAFFLFSGDMANVEPSSYEVNKKALEEWKYIIEKYYPIEMFYNCIGNHERSEKAFNDVFDYLPNEQLSGYGRTVYCIDYCNSRFIVLNSNRENKNYYNYAPEEGSIKNEGYSISEEQRIWLEYKLKNSDKKYNFVMYHAPAFPASHHFGDSLDQDTIERYLLWRIIDKYNVTAVFNGHEHIYCRKIINCAFNTNFKNDVTQIITGGAGANIYGYVTDTRNNLAGPIGIFHYVVVDVYENMLTCNTFDINNNLIDSFTVKKDIAIVFNGDGANKNSEIQSSKLGNLDEENSLSLMEWLKNLEL